MKVSIDEIRKRCEAVFKKAGVSDEDAQIITDVLLETEMRGVFTHGFYRVSNYVNCLKKGGIKPESNIDIVTETPSWASTPFTATASSTATTAPCSPLALPT